MAVNAELQGVLDALNEPRLLVRSDYTVAYANKAFRRRFGIESFEGRRCHELVFHDFECCSLRNRDCPMEHAARSGCVERVIEREFVPGGERFIEIETVPVTAADGNPVYFMERIRVRDDEASLSLREGVVAVSPAARRTVEAVGRVAATDLPVLFCGPGGSGKSGFARMLHENSRRAVNALVKLDCASLTDERFEAELLGRIGRIGRPDEGRVGGLAAQPGGTLYFDEIAALSPGLQRRLLMLVESGLVREAGSAQSVALDWRIVCSTSAPDPDALARSGALRPDLWLRLSVARIDVPPLCERVEDLDELSRILLKRIAGHDVGPLSKQALDVLHRRAWPGNIRELECTLAQAHLRAAGRKILPADLEDPHSEKPRTPVPPPAASSPEALLVLEAAWGGSRAALARRLGLSERTLYRRLREARAKEN